MKKREPYASVTFTLTTDIRKKILDLMKETGRPASDIVLRCVEYALEKVEVRSIKKDIFFPK